MGRVVWLWAALLVSGEAAAQSLTLRWRAPAECPDEAAVLRAVEAAGAPARPGRDLSVDAVVTRPGRWRAVLLTRDGAREGTRTLESRSCSRLVQGVAVVIALAVEAASDAPAPPQPSGTAPAARLPVWFVDDDELPPVLRPPPPAPPPPRSARLRLGASLHARAEWGALPSFAPAMGLGVSVWGTTLGAVLEGSAALSQRLEGPRAGTAMTMGLWRTALLGCALRGAGRWRAGGCAGVELDRVTARGDGFQRSAEDAAWMVGVPLRAMGGVGLGRRVQVLAEAEAMVPLERVQYAVEGVGVLHTMAPVVVRAGLSLMWRTP